MPLPTPRLLLPFVLLAALAQPAAAQCPDGTPPPCGVRVTRVSAQAAPPPPSVRGRSFLVLPFRNVARSEAHEWLVEGSPMLIADALGQWEELSVVPPERLYPALRRHGLAPGDVMAEDAVRRVAEETRAWTAVTGEVLALGEGFRVRARAYDVATGEVLTEVSAQAATGEDVLPVYERIARELLVIAGLDAATPDLAAATTSSLDAYRAYLRGSGHYNRGELSAAHDAFSEAVELDSTFAQAYARLAVSGMRSMEDILDPTGEAYRHAERAAALAQRLPARERDLVLAYAEFFRGQISAARTRFERLVAADSNDVEALEELSDVELIDALLVPGADPPQRRGSLQRAVELAKRVLSLDPTRHASYSTLTSTYLQAADPSNVRVPGVAAEASSLGGYLMSLSGPDEMFAMLFEGDTLALLPIDSFAVLPAERVQASRARARDAAAAWAERWLAAAPDVAQAHAAAAEVFEIVGDYDRALEHLRVADSLGVELIVESVVGRRLTILARARDERGLALADSLLETGYFDGQQALADGYRIEQMTWAFHHYLASGRLDGADALAGRVARAMEGVLPDSALRESFALCVLACRAGLHTPPGWAILPDSVRLHAWEATLRSLDRLPDDGLLARNLFGGLHAFMDPHHYGRLFAQAERPPEAIRARLIDAATAAAEAQIAAERLYRATELVRLAAHSDTSDARIDWAMETFRRIVDIDPAQHRARYQIGRIGATTGRYLDEAERALRDYLAHPDVTELKESAHWRLGMIAEHRGDLETARREYEAALAIDPEFVQAQRWLADLDGD